jgi:hypothetical protein
MPLGLAIPLHVAVTLPPGATVVGLTVRDTVGAADAVVKLHRADHVPNWLTLRPLTCQ